MFIDYIFHSPVLNDNTEYKNIKGNISFLT